MPDAQATFPGIDQVKEWNFTLSQGIAPGTGTMRILPQSLLIQAEGTFSIQYPGGSIDFPNALLNLANATLDDSGQFLILQFLDRRWKWEFGYISGLYNFRKPNGQVEPLSEKTPQELCSLLLDTMHESGYDVSDIPNDTRPAVDWSDDNPAQELSSLVESLGCRIVLGLDNKVRIKQVGVGAPLPPGGAKNVGYGIDPPQRPHKIRYVCGPTKIEMEWYLEPVGSEFGGQIKPIDDLSYKPTDGWKNEYPTVFSGVFLREHRALALQTVYRWYRIRAATTFADQVQAGQLAELVAPEVRAALGLPASSDTDPEKSTKELWQVLPLETELLRVYSTVNSGFSQAAAAKLHGTYWLQDLGDYSNSFDGNTFTDADGNTSLGQEIKHGWSLDAENGVVQFSDFTVKVDPTTGEFTPARLFLRTACIIKSKSTRQPYREIVERVLSTPEQGQPELVRVIKNDDVFRGIRWKNGVNNAAPTIEESGDWQAQANYEIDAAILEYQAIESADVEYVGIIPIDLDGARQQVSWAGGEGGYNTRASINSEHDPFVPSYKEKRRIETVKKLSAGLKKILPNKKNPKSKK
jgi:hypothetical protein